MPTKKIPESEFAVFTEAMTRVLAVPKAELARREAEYKKLADRNPRKRGPKRKTR